MLHAYRNICVGGTQEASGFVHKALVFLTLWACITVRRGSRACKKKIFIYLFMVMWNKGFEEFGLIIFSKEYLGKFNIMKLICLEQSMQRYLYSSLKSQELEEQWTENGI